MRVPLANKPNITQTDVTNKTVIRYFVKTTSTQRITEVDLAQYTALSPLPYYQSISLPWTIGGNDKDIITTGNHIKRGAESKNIAVVEYYDKQMEGLRRVLRNFLEYFSGTVVTQESVWSPPPAPVVTTTSTTSTTTTAPITTTTTSTTTTAVPFEGNTGNWSGWEVVEPNITVTQLAVITE